MKRRSGIPPRVRRRRLNTRALAVVLSFLLLPIPVPTVHCHESFVSAEALADHLVCEHGSDGNYRVDVSEPHWHFELPLREADGSHSSGSEDGEIPIGPPSRYSGAHTQGVVASFAHDRSWQGFLAGPFVGALDSFLQHEMDSPVIAQMNLPSPGARSVQFSVMRC